MKIGFYPKLAYNGICKNKRMYIPYILSGAVMVMMSYIIFFLASTEMLNQMKGGSVLRTLLPIGSVFLSVFSLIFMFYSNSFIIRQRNKEFGLYNVLGMDKGNLGRVMLWENLIVLGISTSVGLIFGIALSKFTELCMVNLLKEEISYTMRIDFTSLLKTLLIFIGIYLLLFLNSFIKVHRSNPRELLNSSHSGEKPPKANWFLSIIGIIILGIAYYVALSIKQPLTSIPQFIIAVVMVIVATYLLFISGSIAFCRFLQKNKQYYYKPNHFVSVSSMVYRMKRNGAGLASICILVTMVLVTLSSTLSMYIGAEDTLKSTHPYEISMRLQMPSMKLFNENSFSKMRNAVNNKVPNKKNVLEYSAIEIVGLLQNGNFIVDQKSHNEIDFSTSDKMCYLNIITLDDYNRIMDKNETLNDDECFISCYCTNFLDSTLTIEGCKPLKVKTVIEKMKISGYITMQSAPYITVVTNNIDTLIAPLNSVTNKINNSILDPYWYYNFDVSGNSEAKISAYEKLCDEVDDIASQINSSSYSYYIGSKEEDRIMFYGLYGALFFIGILLSIVFILATVLIIYYKQISEGFEDKKRFDVMQKVGMTKREIRRSINSQILTVFFLPLLLAGLHLTVAFPTLWKFMQMFMFKNLNIMVIVTILSFVVFALVYALVYKITSNAYYAIVNGGNK